MAHPKLSALPRLAARVNDTGLTVEVRNMTITCDRDHYGIPDDIHRLPHNQKTRYRHVCAACAYERGLADGRAEAGLPPEGREEDDT